MDIYLEFIARHPFLNAAAAALVGIIIAYEVSRATRGYRDIEAADTPGKLNREDALLVDVRAREEYEKGHAINAINVPFADLEDRIDKLKQHEGPVIVYCSNGLTGGKAGKLLVQHGLTDVYNLKGGLIEWDKAGLPRTRPRK